MNKKKFKVIGITMGDPSGIGPEIILKSYTRFAIGRERMVVIGDFNVMEAAYNMLRTDSFRLNSISNMNEFRHEPGILNVLDLKLISMNELEPGRVTAVSGNAAFECIRKAVDLATNGEIDAVVTAPLNKEALHKAGHFFPGHTEILAELTNTKDYAMLLYDRRLSVIHVSTHIRLLEAVTGLGKERIATVIELADKAMRKLYKTAPRIAVAGINPHSGENGLFGDEEIKYIIPAVTEMRNKGIDVHGPVSPDTVFLQAVGRKYDIVVAMYHDQGHIPVKLIGFHSGVNITVGLPFIRTSVDHGTAFEIAWQGKANENSMTKAVRLALRLSK
jgi:4-phospho-D-threonate 3-dehydrogenase / 4-phospho-D-erythronate 3-dehydrogenase